MKRVILSIDAPHFNAGALFVRDFRWECKEAAPIIRWMVGKNMGSIKRYLRKKGWNYEFIPIKEEAVEAQD